MIKNKLLLIFLLTLNTIYAANDVNLICKKNIIGKPVISLLKKEGLCNEKNTTKIINYLITLSNQTYVSFALGEIYLYGIGVPKNFNKAYWLHKISSGNGNKNSFISLGKMNILGQGVDKNCTKGISLLKKVQNIPASSYILGLIYSSQICNNLNLLKAEKYFRYSAEKGYVKAQYNLAMLLDKKNNKDGVLKWLTKSAKQNFIKAQMTLGYGYITGEDIEKNMKKAKYWIKKAKDQNSSQAIKLWNKYELWKY